jgi:cytochrome c biogenesis protein
MKPKNILKLFINLKISIFLLILIIILSSLGTIIEQDQEINFYKNLYFNNSFINLFNLIVFFELDHIYTSWFFFFLIILLAFSLLFCTILRQFPLVNISKGYFFKSHAKYFYKLPFSLKFRNLYYIYERINLKLSSYSYFIYQKRNLLYGYKGLIGRLSPIFVHISLLSILLGASIGAFENYKFQEIIPDGEITHFQNSLFSGLNCFIPNFAIRINDFWIEYEKNIRQFYSDISIISKYSSEIFQKSISVNIPLNFQGVNIYQSDWNLIAFRFKNNINQSNFIYQIFLYPLKSFSKIWITSIDSNNFLVINSFDDSYFLYDKSFLLLSNKTLYETFSPSYYSIINILSATGILIKKDIGIPIIYFGFGSLIVTTFFSYIPYNQIWIMFEKNILWIGNLSNRGKTQIEIEFKRLDKNIFIENKYFLNIFNN